MMIEIIILGTKGRLMNARVTTRHGFIDAVRGIAALLVLVQHSLYQSGILGASPGGLIPTWLELGETGVVAFFLVSGFVIPLSLEKTRSIKLFWVHRALRIYPLYLTVYFVSFAVVAGGNVRTLAGFARNVFAHLLFVQEYIKEQNFVGGSWTLSLELVWYIAISSLFLTVFYWKTEILAGLSFAISALAGILCAVGHHLPMGRLSMLICCVLGLVCYRFHENQLTTRNFGILAGGLALTICVNLLVGEKLFPSAHPTASFGMAADSWALAAIIFFAAFLSRAKSIWEHSTLKFLGRISYSVYLVHPVVLELLTRAKVHGVLAILTTLIATIGVSVLTYRWIESPPIRFGHALKASKFAALPVETKAQIARP